MLLMLGQRSPAAMRTNHDFLGCIQTQTKHCSDGTNTSEGAVQPLGCDKDIFRR